MNGYQSRFGGIRRLVGAEGQERLRRAHVCVIGLGGVGSWAAEALSRSGIGQLTLVDFDEVCISNTNRQLHALQGELGKPKVEVMTRRLQAINPDCVLHPLQAFFTAGTSAQILQTPFDYVLDAIDKVKEKCLLIARCRELSLPLMVVGGAGGRRDPTRIKVSDLAFSSHDILLQQVRRELRRMHGFPHGHQSFGMDCVFSTERVAYPQKDGTVCAEREPDADLRIDCNTGFGTASFVTGTFGFVAAAHVVSKLAGASGAAAPK